MCTHQELETRVAKMLGKDSAMFVLSGTMGNILAVMAHCQKRGAEIFVGSKSHLFLYEQANMAQVGNIRYIATYRVLAGYCTSFFQAL